MNPNKRDYSKLGLSKPKKEKIVYPPGWYSYQGDREMVTLSGPDGYIVAVLEDGTIINLHLEHGSLRISKSTTRADGESTTDSSIAITPYSTNVFMVK